MSHSSAPQGSSDFCRLPLLSVDALHRLFTCRTRQPASPAAQQAHLVFQVTHRVLLPVCPTTVRPGLLEKVSAALCPAAAGAGHLTTHGLGRLLLWDFRIYSQGQKAFCRKESQPAPSHPSPAPQHSSAPGPAVLLGAFDFLIGEQVRLQKVLSRQADPDSPPLPQEQPKKFKSESAQTD